MKETTRIHIAKTPYDIELGAKKELEKYIEALSLYADDADVLTDIEIRITELLAERGVAADGIIATDDVRAIRSQLGEPKEFIGDGDIAIGAAVEGTTHGFRRRLYRDSETAVLGGVLAGIAKYFDINPLWTRLGFVVLLCMTFGAAALAYAVLWMIIPVARTAAEKLELVGKPVTLASIKELNESSLGEAPENRTAELMKTVLAYVVGAAAVFGALLALLATVWVVVGPVQSNESLHSALNTQGQSWVAWAWLGLFVLSGLLLSTLLVLLARALFTKSWTKKLGTAVLAVSVSGVVAFGSGLLVFLVSERQSYDPGALTASKVQLAPEFTAVKRLTVKTDSSITVAYTVDSRPRYDLRTADTSMKPTVVIDGDSATITLHASDSAPSLLQLYGPALETIASYGGSMNYTHDQASIAVTAADGGSLWLDGSYGSVAAKVESRGGYVELGSATVGELTADVPTGTVSAGVVRTLAVTQPTACPADNASEVAVQAVTSGMLTYNGASQVMRTFETACGNVRLGSAE